MEVREQPRPVHLGSTCCGLGCEGRTGCIRRGASVGAGAEASPRRCPAGYTRGCVCLRSGPSSCTRPSLVVALRVRETEVEDDILHDSNGLG